MSHGWWRGGGAPERPSGFVRTAMVQQHGWVWFRVVTFSKGKRVARFTYGWVGCLCALRGLSALRRWCPVVPRGAPWCPVGCPAILGRPLPHVKSGFETTLPLASGEGRGPDGCLGAGACALGGRLRPYWSHQSWAPGPAILSGCMPRLAKARRLNGVARMQPSINVQKVKTNSHSRSYL